MGSIGHCRVSEQCPPAFGSQLNHVFCALSAFDLMASLNPCLYPASKWSDLLKSRTLEMLCSSGGSFFIWARAVYDNLHIARRVHNNGIDIRWVGGHRPRNNSIVHTNFFRSYIKNEKIFAIVN